MHDLRLHLQPVVHLFAAVAFAVRRIFNLGEYE